MAIVTFFGREKEQVGKTLSLVAIATNMAIEHNKKVLIFSASYNNNTLKNCYWNEKEIQKQTIIKQKGKVSLDNGMESLAKIIESNKITPELITDYTRIVFKNRLEVLLGFEKEENNSEDDEETQQYLKENNEKKYVDIVKLANQYYDTVFVDLDNEIEQTSIEAILKMSDVVVAMSSQRISSIEKVKKNKENFGNKGILVIGKYDKKSKYTIKNITRYLGEKKEISVIPYNTLFFEAAEEAAVPDLFLKLRNIKDKNDENSYFIQHVRKLSEEITRKIQEARMINK